MKTIVTHLNPDLDAVFSVWLVKRFLPGWSKAEVKFVPAGETLGGKPVDSDLEILHCDTGGGKFDHHQNDDFVCAATLVFEEIIEQNEKLKDWQKKALERMLAVVNEIDHARFLSWPEPAADRYDFCLHQIIGGMTGNFKDDPEKMLDYALPLIDSVFKIFGEKVEADEILNNGLEFKTKWGKGIALETNNAEVHYLALRKGFAVVLRKRSKTGHLGIYGNWQNGVDFRKIFEILKKKDPRADWFLHSSGCLVLNGSTSNPKMKPTKLELKQVVKIFDK